MTDSPLPSLAVLLLEEAELAALADAADHVSRNKNDRGRGERRRDNPHHFSDILQFAAHNVASDTAGRALWSAPIRLTNVHGLALGNDEGSPAVEAIAVEHVRWCQSQGMTPRDIVTVFGYDEYPLHPTFDDAVWLLAMKWAQL